MDKKITLKDVKKHISKCKRLGVRYDWLGFVENKDLTFEVQALFAVGWGWDWVNGNEHLRALEIFTK
jgi:hypothetical protein